MKARAKNTAQLSIALGDEPPKEVRLFAKGWNETEKGRYLFDDDAAKRVMVAYEKLNALVTTDLEHQMFDDRPSPDPTAKDARAWQKLEVRNGELWAVEIDWTDDAIARLSAKRQRYLSPLFKFDPKSGRVIKLLNIALTSMPATWGAADLIAASARDLRALSSGTSFDDVQRAISEALVERFPQEPGGPGICDGPWVVDVFDATFIYQLKGQLYELTYTFDGAAAALGAAPVEVKRTYTPAAQQSGPAAALNQTSRLSVGGSSMLDPKLIQPAIEALKNQDAAKALEILESLLVSAAGGDPASADASPSGAPAEETAAAVAASARLMRLTSKTAIADALEVVDVWHESHKTAEAAKAKVEAENATIALSKRTANAKTLIALGAETPHTSGLANGKLVQRLVDEPLAEQNARIASLSAARGGAPPPLTPPAGGGFGGPAEDGSLVVALSTGNVTLSAREVAMCEEMKVDPKAYAATKKKK